MDRTAIQQALREMIENDRGESLARFEEDTYLRTDLGLDSVDMITLDMEIQDRFHLRLTPADLAHVEKVSDLIDVLQTRLSQRAAA